MKTYTYHLARNKEHYSLYKKSAENKKWGIKKTSLFNKQS